MSDSVNERVPLRDGTEGLPEARELPRPATPGPWKAGGRLGEIDMSGTVFTVNADNRHVAYCHARPGDGPAIAALPEWIEDRDRWKARAEQAEAERGAATDRATEHEMVLSAIADACVSADHPSDVQRVNVIMDLLTAHGYAREAADV